MLYDNEVEEMKKILFLVCVLILISSCNYEPQIQYDSKIHNCTEWRCDTKGAIGHPGTRLAEERKLDIEMCYSGHHGPNDEKFAICNEFIEK